MPYPPNWLLWIVVIWFALQFILGVCKVVVYLWAVLWGFVHEHRRRQRIRFTLDAMREAERRGDS